MSDILKSLNNKIKDLTEEIRDLSIEEMVTEQNRKAAEISLDALDMLDLADL